jgi:hypothetical protein
MIYDKSNVIASLVVHMSNATVGAQRDDATATSWSTSISLIECLPIGSRVLVQSS